MLSARLNQGAVSTQRSTHISTKILAAAAVNQRKTSSIKAAALLPPDWKVKINPGVARGSMLEHRQPYLFAELDKRCAPKSNTEQHVTQMIVEESVAVMSPVAARR